MARQKKAALGELLLDVAFAVADQTLLGGQLRRAGILPDLDQQLLGTLAKPKRRRKETKQPGEIAVGKGVFYTPPPKRGQSA